MMALRRKQRTATASHDREYKVRLPEDVAQRIALKATDEQRPLNRIIINELAAFPEMEKRLQGAKFFIDFDSMHGRYETLLARYASRVAGVELSEQMLWAVDAVLKTEGGAQQAAIEKLRVVRGTMLRTPKEKAK